MTQGPVETPRTDAEEARCGFWPDHKRYVSAAFARTLEREIASLQQQLAAKSAEAARMREALETLAAQSSGVPGSTARSDCMAALARAALTAAEGGKS